jgi:hypothetical protein
MLIKGKRSMNSGFFDMWWNRTCTVDKEIIMTIGKQNIGILLLSSRILCVSPLLIHRPIPLINATIILHIQTHILRVEPARVSIRSCFGSDLIRIVEAL